MKHPPLPLHRERKHVHLVALLNGASIVKNETLRKNRTADYANNQIVRLTQ
jgi:hypothetical protein